MAVKISEVPQRVRAAAENVEPQSLQGLWYSLKGYVGGSDARDYQKRALKTLGFDDAEAAQIVNDPWLEKEVVPAAVQVLEEVQREKEAAGVLKKKNDVISL
jgi:hypothetical protein